MKKFKALLFDINGTVSDIHTAEEDDNVFRTTANFLRYHGVMISGGTLKNEYIELNRRQRRESPEDFPEFDVSGIFLDLVRRFRQRDVADEKTVADCAATVFRAASLYYLELYTGVREVLTMLKKIYRLGAVSDGQSLWAMPELQMVGLADFFECITVSGDVGFRKPDPRIFNLTLEKMGIKSEEAVFIGNDMYRDIYGSGIAGIKNIFFHSNQGEQRFAGRDPDYVVYRFNEIPAAVKFLEQNC